MSVSILVVDDEPDVAELFRQRFRRETRQGSYVMHYAASGVEALDRLARMTRNRQRCMLLPDGAATLASRIFRISGAGTGSGFSRRIDRVVAMISNRFGISSGMTPSTRPELARSDRHRCFSHFRPAD